MCDGDSIRTVKILAEVQENGIIRLYSTGRILGRLTDNEEVSFNKLSKKASNEIVMGAEKFEHLLNCMCNQKYIHEQSAEV